MMHAIRQREASYSWISKTAGFVSSGMVLALLFYANLSDGAARPFPLFLTRVLVAAVLLLQIPLLFSKENYGAAFPSFLVIPISVFITFLLVIGIQCFYGLRILELGVGTVNPYATFSSLGQLMGYFVFFILCVQFAAHRSNVERLIFCMAILICGITVWGIAERFMGRDLWGTDHLAQDSFGPFVNPNHYSAFVALSFPLLFAGLYPRRFFLLFLTTLVFTGLLLSGGRLGIIVITCSLIFYFIALVLRRHFKLGALAAFVILAGSLLVFRAGEAESLFRTFSSDSLKAAVTERLQLSKESLGIFFKYPWLGSGLGTLAFVSPNVITVMGDSVEWDHAHNDYVELLAETGAVGFLLFVCALGTIFIYGLRTLWKNSRPDSRWILIQAMTAIFIIAIFEWADFPLKIPALAFLFILQLALLVTAIPSPPQNHGISFGRGAFLSVICLGGALFLSSWAVKDYQSARFAEHRENHIQNLEKAIELEPLNSGYWHQLGLEYLEGERDRKKALQAFRQAAYLSPTYPRHWFSLGRLEYQEGLTMEGLSSLKKAVTWGPHKSGYSLYLMAVYLKESEESKTDEIREKNLGQAKGLFDQLNAMKNLPGKEDQKRWMGPVYAEKFEQQMLQWNLNKKESP